MRKRVEIISVTLFVVVIICVCSIYFIGETPNELKGWMENKVGGELYSSRGIGTKKDLWLNGYLGIFFRFKYFGGLNWLALPLFIYFFTTINKRKRWEIALGFALGASCIFLCTQGYQNYRYQSTLFPIVLTSIFLFGWRILENKSQLIKGVVFAVCFIFVFMTIYSQRNIFYLDYLKPYAFADEFPFPYKIIKYLNDDAKIDDNEVILECNQKILYYYTNRRGINIHDKRMGSVYPKYSEKEKPFYALKNKLGIGYVLTDTVFEYLSKGSTSGRFLKNLIKIDCDLIHEEHGYKLYKLRESPYILTIEAFNKRDPIFQTRFSDRRGNDDLTIKDVKESKVPFEIQGYRGEFIFTSIPSDNGNIVRVILSSPWKDVHPELQFGFCDTSSLNINDGDIVSVIARVRFPGKAKRGADLFIQDKAGGWIREKVSMQGDSWRDYLITKKIREGFSDFNIGIYWEPDSPGEWLDVQSVRVYVRDRDR